MDYKGINIYISDNDIKNYIMVKKANGLYIPLEALYVNYLKESKELNSDIIQLLLSKNDGLLLPVDCINGNTGKNNNVCVFLNNYKDYLKTLKFDQQGICHAIIPLIKYYNLTSGVIDKDYLESVVLDIIDDFDLDTSNYGKFIFKSLSNYELCEKIKIVPGEENKSSKIELLISSNNSFEEIRKYQEVYDYNNMEKLKKLVKERM